MQNTTSKGILEGTNLIDAQERCLLKIASDLSRTAKLANLNQIYRLTASVNDAKKWLDCYRSTGEAIRPSSQSTHTESHILVESSSIFLCTINTLRSLSRHRMLEFETFRPSLRGSIKTSKERPYIVLPIMRLRGRKEALSRSSEHVRHHIPRVS